MTNKREHNSGAESDPIEESDGTVTCLDCEARWVPSDVLEEARRVVEMYRTRARTDAPPAWIGPHLLAGFDQQNDSAVKYLDGLLARIDAVLGKKTDPSSE